MQLGSSAGAQRSGQLREYLRQKTSQTPTGQVLDAALHPQPRPNQPGAAQQLGAQKRSHDAQSEAAAQPAKVLRAAGPGQQPPGFQAAAAAAAPRQAPASEAAQQPQAGIAEEADFEALLARFQASACGVLLSAGWPPDPNFSEKDLRELLPRLWKQAVEHGFRLRYPQTLDDVTAGLQFAFKLYEVKDGTKQQQQRAMNPPQRLSGTASALQLPAGPAAVVQQPPSAALAPKQTAAALAVIPHVPVATAAAVQQASQAVHVAAAAAARMAAVPAAQQAAHAAAAPTAMLRPAMPTAAAVAVPMSLPQQAVALGSGGAGGGGSALEQGAARFAPAVHAAQVQQLAHVAAPALAMGTVGHVVSAAALPQAAVVGPGIAALLQGPRLASVVPSVRATMAPLQQQELVYDNTQTTAAVRSASEAVPSNQLSAQQQQRLMTTLAGLATQAVQASSGQAGPEARAQPAGPASTVAAGAMQQTSQQRTQHAQQAHARQQEQKQPQQQRAPAEAQAMQPPKAPRPSDLLCQACKAARKTPVKRLVQALGAVLDTYRARRLASGSKRFEDEQLRKAALNLFQLLSEEDQKLLAGAGTSVLMGILARLAVFQQDTESGMNRVAAEIQKELGVLRRAAGGSSAAAPHVGTTAIRLAMGPVAVGSAQAGAGESAGSPSPGGVRTGATAPSGGQAGAAAGAGTSSQATAARQGAPGRADQQQLHSVQVSDMELDWLVAHRQNPHMLCAYEDFLRGLLRRQAGGGSGALEGAADGACAGAEGQGGAEAAASAGIDAAAAAATAATAAASQQQEQQQKQEVQQGLDAATRGPSREMLQGAGRNRGERVRLCHRMMEAIERMEQQLDEGLGTGTRQGKLHHQQQQGQ